MRLTAIFSLISMVPSECETLKPSQRHINYSQDRGFLNDKFKCVIQEDCPFLCNRSPIERCPNNPLEDGKLKLSKEPEAKFKMSVFTVILKTLILVLLYYCSSIGLTFYQKWLLKVSINSYSFFQRIDILLYWLDRNSISLFRSS